MKIPTLLWVWFIVVMAAFVFVNGYYVPMKHRDNMRKIERCMERMDRMVINP